VPKSAKWSRRAASTAGSKNSGGSCATISVFVRSGAGGVLILAGITAGYIAEKTTCDVREVIEESEGWFGAKRR
jgi:hypothetical protein